jgi:hypothetical protein
MKHSNYKRKLIYDINELIENFEEKFPPLENIILQDTKYIYQYTIDFLNNRWISAECKLKENPKLWKSYCNYFNI